MAESGELLDEMLQDVLNAVEHFWGKDGLSRVSQHTIAANQARESNRVMDELDLLYGTAAIPQGKTGQ